MKDRAEPDHRLLLVANDHEYDPTQGIPPAKHEHGSVRKLSHAGREIEIHTHYRVVIDGQEFPDPFHVLNDGSVSYHGLPQYSTSSAVDLVKRIVDELLGDDPPPIGDDDEALHGHGKHNEDREHEGGH